MKVNLQDYIALYVSIEVVRTIASAVYDTGGKVWTVTEEVSGEIPSCRDSLCVKAVPIKKEEQP